MIRLVGCLVGWRVGWKDERMDGWTNKWVMDGWTNKWGMDGWTNKWVIDGWIFLFNSTTEILKCVNHFC